MNCINFEKGIKEDELEELNFGLKWEKVAIYKWIAF